MAAASSAETSSASGTNVKVAVRVRPFNARELDMGCTNVVEMEDNTAKLMPCPGSAGVEPRQFAFDHCYGWDTEQEAVYKDLALPIVQRAMEGFNGTVFAYGQTGSGKSWSMMGGEGQPGIIPRLNDGLFARIAALREAFPLKEILITVAYLEIYNEVIKDLLNPSDKKLEVRQHPKLGIYVAGLAELVVDSAAGVAGYIESGNRVRKVASTSMNARSSRSHSCFVLKIKQKDVEKLGEGKQRTTELSAKVNLVDLAGSERQSKTGAEGARLKEGAAINKSLSCLGQVITALAEGRKHVPYRDSKLTRLLQESLGGNSVTVMVAAVSPADNNYDETLSTLRYASNAKRIKNVTKRNEDVSQQVIRELREEIASLREALAEAEAAKAAGGEGSAVSSEQMLDMEEKLLALKQAQAEDWEKQRTLSELYEREREKNLRDEAKIKSVMLTIKEEKVATLKHIASLSKAREKAKKVYEKRKAAVSPLRDAISHKLGRYQELLLDGGEDGVHKDELASLIDGLEADQGSLEMAEDAVAVAKSELKVVMKEERAAREEAAAQTLLLEEDAELRGKIAAEERAALAAENEKLLAEAMAAQRAELQAETDRQRAELTGRLKASGETGANHDLHLQVLQGEADKRMLELQLTELRRKAEAALATQADDHAAAVRSMKARELRMFHTVLEGVDQEMRTLREAKADLASQLGAAAEDLQYMGELNTSLMAQLQALGVEPKLPQEEL